MELILVTTQVSKIVRPWGTVRRNVKKSSTSALLKDFFSPKHSIKSKQLDFFKGFFEWLNFSIYVVKPSCIANYNYIVLYYISTDNVPQIRSCCTYSIISIVIF